MVDSSSKTRTEWYDECVALQQDGDLAAAVSELKKLVEAHPDYGLARLALGVFLYQKGDEEGAIEFVPRFVLGSASIQDRLVYERKTPGGLFYGQIRGTEEGLYYDSYDPIAFAKIARKEGRKGQNFLDTTHISTRKILPGETVWGIATWTDVDPRIDRFSVYISGLTNALRWEITGDVDPNQVGAGRDVWRKVLKINFISPGDEAHSGKEIYNNLPGELDYEWIYL